MKHTFVYSLITVIFACLFVNQVTYAQEKSPISGFNLNRNQMKPTNVKPAHVKTAKIAPETIPSRLRFIQNKNQWAPQIKYVSDLPGGKLYVKDASVQYIFYDDASATKGKGVHPQQRIPTQGHSYEVKFLNLPKNTPVEPRGIQKTPERRNYYIGNDSKHWAEDVPSFKNLYYYQLYPGIDLKFYEKNNTLKYEFVVSAQADPQQILLEYNGLSAIKIKEGNLHLETSVNTIIEKKPYCYQLIGGKEVAVESAFLLKNNRLSFDFPQGYNPKYDLIIDPELIFSTYSGSTSDNWGFTATFDEEGNAYSGGTAQLFGANDVVRLGPFTFANTAGGNDILILKFNATGTVLEYATLLGGTVVEFPHSLIVNNQNELLIYGTTGSPNFPVTTGVIQENFQGGRRVEVSGNEFSLGSDIFVAKLNPDGTLNASTYLGGIENDGLNTSLRRNYADEARGEVIVDSSDFVYIASSTFSDDFPIIGANARLLSGMQDGIVLKLSPELDSIVWSTAIGGNANDAAFSMKLGKENQLYLCGATEGADFPTGDSVWNALPIGGEDGYVARINSEGAFEFATYLGTTSDDQAFLLDLDTLGNVYTFGLSSGNYPVSLGVYNNPGGKQFIQKLDADLSQGLLSTVVGAGRFSNTADISPTAFLVNECGNIYITGWGSNLDPSSVDNLGTTGLPITDDAEQSTTDGNDIYIAILERDFASLVYGTYFGGSSSGDHVDGGTSRFNKDGVIYHAVCASCGQGFTNDFPTTPNAWSSFDLSNNCNNAVFKFDIGSLIADFQTRDTTDFQIVTNLCEFPQNVLLDYEGIGVSTWEWQVNGEIIGTTPDVEFLADTTGVYDIQLTVGNPVSCLEELTIQKQLPVSIVSVADIISDSTICYFDSYQLNASIDASSAPITFLWEPELGLSDPNILNPVASPDETTTYVLTAIDPNGCTSTDSVTVNVIEELKDTFNILNFANIPVEQACAPSELLLTYDIEGAGTLTWTWDIEGIGTFTDEDSLLVSFTEPGDYSITLTAVRDLLCPQTETTTQVMRILGVEVEVSDSTSICHGETVDILATANIRGSQGPITYQWSPSLGLSDPNIPNPTASPSETTLYTVTVTTPEGCQDVDTLLIEVTPDIELSFEASLGSDCAQPSTLTIDNTSQGSEGIDAYTFEWVIADSIAFTGLTPNPIDFRRGGSAEVILRAFAGACEFELIDTIAVENNLLVPPNVITPNEDGVNDLFEIPDRENYRLEIYTRWGGLIYESENYQNDWGEDATPGVYYYLLTSPAGVKCKGWITVITE